MSRALDEYQRITPFKPNPMQEELFNLITEKNPALLLKSPTGSGKTEAVLIPSLIGERRLFLIFPSRSLVEDQIGRCEKYLCKMSKALSKPYSLVIDTGGQSSRIVFDNGERKPDGSRHLYDGNVIITTFDKFLYRFFGFGEPNKSYIFPFRIHHSHTRNLFCFDESHSYDKVAFTNFVRLIKSLYKVNLDLVVMTATMPEAYQKELNFLDNIDYIREEKLKSLNESLKHLSPSKQIEFIHTDAKDVRDEICAYVSSRCELDKRIIVTVETVGDVTPIYQFMKEREVGENVFLYHGRLSDGQRRKVYQKLKQIEEDNGSYFLFTTSAIEVGCDLNAHLLVTELCNPDQLIQRAGRCNRKGQMEDAKIVVVGHKIRHFLRTIPEETEARYLEILQAQSGGNFKTNAFLELIQPQPHHDYRSEMLFDMLYEYVYEAQLENKPLHDRGLVVTRSFEPSITLTTKVPESESPQRFPENAVSVPIRQCMAFSRDDKDFAPNLVVYQRYFDDYHEEFKFRHLERGGCVYFKDLFIEVPEDLFSEECGYVHLPKVFERRNLSGYQQRFVYPTEDREIWLHYLRDLEEDEVQVKEDNSVENSPKSEMENESPSSSGKDEQLSLF